jgi:hypothetical protein
MFSLMLLFAFSPVLQAPAAPAPRAGDPTATALAAAVRALDAQPALYFAGDVAQQEREDDRAGGGAVQVIVSGTGGDEPHPFHGSIEVLRTEKKELLIASVRALPEVVVFDDGTHQLLRTTIEDEPVGARRLATDLVSLLDLQHLAKEIEGATQVTAGTPAEDGSRSIECELSTRSVRTQGTSVVAMMQPKVLAVRAHFDLDARGAIVGLELRVVRSDPTARMRRGALGDIAAGGATRTVRVREPQESDDAEEGATSVYRLRLRTEMPSMRAREALLALRKLADPKRD